MPGDGRTFDRTLIVTTGTAATGIANGQAVGLFSADRTAHLPETAPRGTAITLIHRNPLAADEIAHDGGGLVQANRESPRHRGTARQSPKRWIRILLPSNGFGSNAAFPLRRAVQRGSTGPFSSAAERRIAACDDISPSGATSSERSARPWSRRCPHHCRERGRYAADELHLHLGNAVIIMRDPLGDLTLIRPERPDRPKSLIRDGRKRPQ